VTLPAEASAAGRRRRGDRRRGNRALAAAGLSLALQACASSGTNAGAPPGAPLPPLADRIDAVLAEPPFDRVSWGVLVVDSDTGRPLFERNADLLFIPGSNQKLPVSVAALGLLGPDFRWETTLYSRALPTGGTIPGDLYLAGRGDPTLGPPFHASTRDALGALADSLVGEGARRVEGRLVVDVAAWDSTTVPDSWMVEDLPVTAGATGGAFSVGQGEIEVTVEGAARAGGPAMIAWEPGELRPSFVQAEVSTVPVDEAEEVSARFLPESRKWLIEGAVGPGETIRLNLPARDPVGVAAMALARVFEDRGVSLELGVAVMWDADEAVENGCALGNVPSCAGMLRVTGLASPPLSEVVAEVLGPSQNWTAEQLVRTLGAERGERGSWAEGFSVMESYLTEATGLGPDEWHFEDGSGLSNHNLISPRALAAMLVHARRQPWGPVFRNALAEPGEEGSTLESRLFDLEGRLFAKTGSLRHVNSLSGYLTLDSGDEIAFSLLSNGADLPASTVRERIDALVREIARGP
jgi:D-alanyl-D-alanine carboxypeptidase/D-alanyl-D-alanine-endopeptidase (penicillin-binding protein 4)